LQSHHRLKAGESRQGNFPSARSADDDPECRDYFRPRGKAPSTIRSQLTSANERAWSIPGFANETKKRIVRTLIDEIVVRVEDNALALTIRWHGGDHSHSR
jgi:hypothetical protein